jgi:hypothetical protein
VVDAIDSVASRYSDNVASVDTSTKNPARLMCLPGTLKCKGEDLDDRPWRPVTIDTPLDQVESHAV